MSDFPANERPRGPIGLFPSSYREAAGGRQQRLDLARTPSVGPWSGSTGSSAPSQALPQRRFWRQRTSARSPVTERHRVEEGLMLRSDIHRLFDSGLLTITPGLAVCVAPSLAGHTLYSTMGGSPLCIPEDAPVDREAIAEHYSATIATW
ncbi:HNH endonuclease signature motif containing protein [Streptomyces sp. NPDC002668]|uniref:HNH endonuclease signature motif containing protein n=1 Tax=Streptomyces sp. NPDC002668 TaxID=3154422 RepID=UPI00331F90AE